MISPRTITSAVRTAIYGGLGGLFAFGNPETMEILDAFIIGAVLADYITWMIWNLLSLPRFIWQGCYDACVNVLFGFFLMRFIRVDIDQPELIALAFVSFMLVMALKLAFYAVKHMQNSLSG